MAVTQNRIVERFRGIVGRDSVGGVVWRGSRLGALGAAALLCALWRGLRSWCGGLYRGARGRRLWAKFGARGEGRNVGRAQRGRTARTMSDPRPLPPLLKGEGEKCAVTLPHLLQKIV